ncbi:MAG: squalene/phytoene synthase family protein [Akkermansiaceae bacterium]|nr:squalene/phytoene synthase family protein [Akkermansiaceae bacterium]NNM29813.1 squalene/phytoene synthase family protein [Akkermansiaceae bacterium]
MSTAAEITRKSKSNLAFALSCVRKDRRRDLVTFYAFCRTIDDIADDPGRPADHKRNDLDAWRHALAATTAPADDLQRAVVELRDRRHLDPQHLLDIIDGCESDIVPQRFGTFEDLQQYSYRVASAVGLACLPLFGASDASRDYAIKLGHALQLTNILRDVGEDLANGVRIYLPLADLARFQYTERDLVGRVHDGRFLALMAFEADRAEALFGEARAALPAPDYRCLRPAEVMRRIYRGLLHRMRRDRFRVFDKRYSLSKPLKAGILVREMICGKFSNS